MSSPVTRAVLPVLLIVDGVVSGNAGFHAHGHGRVILNANNTYTGATRVSVTDSGATVFVNGSQVLSDGEHSGAKPGRAVWGRGRKTGSG